MEFFKNTNINFVKFRYIAITASWLIIVAGIISMIIKGGFSMGVDFNGGILLEVGFNQKPQIEKVRSALKEANFEESIIQQVADKNNLIIRIGKEKTANSSGGDYEKIKYQIVESFEKKFGKNSFSLERTEYVGPVVGKELIYNSGMAILLSFIGITVYLSSRFKFKYGIAAFVAVVHDVLITLAFLSFTNTEFTPTILAAILTLIGYSNNDTIVVFDRIRENTHKYREADLSNLINRSVNETLSRTIITSLMTFTSITILFLFAGPVIHDFAFTLMIGIVTGTYSSIYIASPILIDWDRYITKNKKNI